MSASTSQATLAMAGMSLYGRGLGRAGHSTTYYTSLQRVAVETCKGNLSFEDLKQALAAAELAGMDKLHLMKMGGVTRVAETAGIGLTVLQDMIVAALTSSKEPADGAP